MFLSDFPLRAGRVALSGPARFCILWFGASLACEGNPVLAHIRSKLSLDHSGTTISSVITYSFVALCGTDGLQNCT
ncbi:MAG: hypothetical protein IH987_03185 [Planctomycetes bacterium]|nr:hypothetical protein [Planctomycetota bacterium]